MWGIVKQTNIHIMGIIREENRKDIPRKNGWKQLKFIEKKKKMTYSSRNLKKLLAE